MAKHVTICFELTEEVTPDLFARKVAVALAQMYTLRPGEQCYALGSEEVWIVDRPLMGHEGVIPGTRL